MKLRWKILTAFLGALFLAGCTPPFNPPATHGTTVKINVESGHGSGFHVGNGHILTAAHVVGSQTAVQIETENGSTAVADVLWVNRDYDVALVHASSKTIRKLPAAKLACEHRARPGETVEAVGNPMDMKFAHTFGRITGSTSPEIWKVNLVVDMTIAGGMSGGPVFNTNGHVIGMSVGVYRAAPLGVVVPARTICFLLGK